ncbi:MAG TPA: hypothetical protein VLT36_04855 [Candidatus Dormibacteraeota bacterium]|nr:hypothetical protein [Candidatus Dormibacteraeota bacterium]
MKRRIVLFLACTLATLLAVASIPKPRDLREKVRDAELVVYGVATIEDPLFIAHSPVKKSYKFVVLQTLWPTNQPVPGMLTVDHWVSTDWPDSWWRYNSTTGVFFFERTTTLLKRARQRDPSLPPNYFGSNVWRLLGARGDCYEPSTNLDLVKQTIAASKR